MSSESTLGGKLGPRLAALVAQASLNTKIAAGPHMSRVAVDAMNVFMDGIGKEAQTTSSEVWKRLRDTQQLPTWADRTAEFAQTGRGEWSALLNHAAISGGIGNSILSLLNNDLAPAVNELIRLSPNGLIDTGTAAQLVARGIAGFDAGANEAAKQGIDVSRFRQLVTASRSTPDIATGLEMVRKGIINSDGLDTIMRNQALDDDWHARVLRLIPQELSPDQLAALVTFGVLTEGAAAPVALKSGISKNDFHLLVLGNGQPPSTTDLLEAYRRGFINKERLERGITQGPVRNEWIDVIERLRYAPPSPSAALDAATQNLLSEDDARKVLQDNGIDPGAFDWMLESHGRPLSVTDAGDLYNRGVITHAQAKTMFLESSVKNKYVDLVFKLFEQTIPMETVRIAYREGIIGHDEVIKRLKTLGYSTDDAEILASVTLSQRHVTEKNLSESLLRELYRDQIITTAQATEGLTILGYTDDEAAWILATDDARISNALRDQAISGVHTRYVAYRIQETKAATLLDELHVTSDQRNALLDTWNIEREATMAHLTPSQIATAWKRTIFTDEEAVTRLIQSGYAKADAQVILQLSLPAPKPDA